MQPCSNFFYELMFVDFLNHSRVNPLSVCLVMLLSNDTVESDRDRIENCNSVVKSKEIRLIEKGK